MASVGETVAITAAAAGLELGVKGLTMLGTRATLYVRVMTSAGDSTGLAGNENVAVLKDLVKSRGKNHKSLPGRAGQMVNQAALALTSVKKKEEKIAAAVNMTASGFIPFDVQYNPSSIRMTSLGGKLKKYTAMGEETNNAFHSIDKASATTMSVQLYFDDINIADAFPATALAEPNANVSGGLDTVAAIGVNVLGDGYSIKKKVDGLISLLLHQRTREVIFVWNDMFFHGNLISVSASYTMFNHRGNPIKALVDLQIRQNNNTFSSELKYWEEAFELGFSESPIKL